MLQFFNLSHVSRGLSRGCGHERSFRAKRARPKAVISIRARPLAVIPEAFDKILLQHLIPDPSEAGWFVRTNIASFYLRSYGYFMGSYRR